MNFFVLIDCQNDFATGSLGNPEFVKTIPTIKSKLDEARKNGDTIVYTRDTHHDNYMNTGEGKHLPVIHCIEGSDGWQIVDELTPTDDDVIINKEHFGFTAWEDYIQSGDTVTMVGTVSSICVASNALAIKAIENVEVNIIKDCCADLSNEGQEAAMKVMAACQCNII